jgi:hypothetical protein
LDPLGTAATNRPIVPAPGDYDDGEIGGMMIGRGNRSTRRKPAPVPLYPPQTPHAERTRTRTAVVGKYVDIVQHNKEYQKNCIAYFRPKVPTQHSNTQLKSQYKSCKTKHHITFYIS